MAPVLEVGIGDLPADGTWCATGAVRRERDDAIRIRVGKRLEEDGVDDTEHGRVRADAQRHHRDSEAPKTRIPARGAQRVSHIAADVIHPADRSRVTMPILGLLHAAESLARRRQRLLRGQSLPFEVVLHQQKMRVQLSRQVRLSLERPDDVTKLVKQAAETDHHDRSSISSLSTRLASRRQRPTCSTSAREPALVMA